MLRLPLFLALCLSFLCCEPRQAQPAPSPAPNGQFPDSAYTAELQNNPAFRLNQLADSARDRGDYAKAILIYQQSMDSAALRADSLSYYDSKLDVACVYDRLDELPKAIEMTEPLLDAFIRLGDSSIIGRAYSTLAAFYGRAGMFEKCAATAQKGLQIAKKYGNTSERCAAYNQLAYAYTRQGHWAEALPLLDTALAIQLASGVFHQLPIYYLNIGSTHRELGQWKEARHYLNACVELADSLKQPHVRSVAFLRLSQIAEATNNYADALAFFKQSTSLQDSIFSEEKTRNLQELEVAYKTKEQEQELKLLEATRKAENLRRNFVLALLLLALAIAAWQIFQWRKKHRVAQRELENKQQELREFTQLLLIKNSRLAELEQVARAGNSPSDPEQKNAATIPKAPTLSASKRDDDDLYSQHILTDSDWAVFKRHFDTSYPGYRQRLRHAFPQLTSAEERMFLLLKLNLSSKEAADMQGISLESIKKYRYRLRKRLGLEQEEGLELFVREF